jgi:formamidopyrimidine-DNA glycosylase
MPELPEVETTTRGLQKEVVGLTIKDIWTDLDSKDKRQKENVANKTYFKYFKKEVIGAKIIKAERRAKNILVHLDNKKTILIHLKMTGHLLYGEYECHTEKKKEFWLPKNKNKDNPLNNPFNRFVHVVFTLSNKKHLAFCDARKFGKMTLVETPKLNESKHLAKTGPEPFDENLDTIKLAQILNKKINGKIKTVLMDANIIAGIGNIYSDEILWSSGIHPERKILELEKKEISLIFKNMRELLSKGIDFGGDSMSDYRNIYGLPGKFQMEHKAYRRTGEKCLKKNCNGVIMRKVINSRSGHFCSHHQK